MAIYIYPENYVEPELSQPIIPNPTQRSAIKTKMQNYIINQNKSILIYDLIQIASDYIWTNRRI